MIDSALDACNDLNDTWCGRDLMIVVHLFLTEQEDSKVVRLLDRVYHHAIWNRVTFWEDLLLIGLCEAQAAESICRRKVVPGTQFVHPAMTSFLYHFVTYLKDFGID